MAEQAGKTLVMLVFEVTDGPLGSGELARKQYAEQLVDSITDNKDNHPSLKTFIEVAAGDIWHASVINMSFDIGKKEGKCSTASGESSPEETTGA